MIDQSPYFVQRACGADEHELVETNGKRQCRICKFTDESLRNVIGQDV